MIEEMPACALCGERIGVYESTVALDSTAARRTSIANERGLAASGAILVHASCAPGVPAGERAYLPAAAAHDRAAARHERAAELFDGLGLHSLARDERAHARLDREGAVA